MTPAAEQGHAAKALAAHTRRHIESAREAGDAAETARRAREQLTRKN
jgi:hypothetical protein